MGREERKRRRREEKEKKVTRAGIEPTFLPTYLPVKPFKFNRLNFCWSFYLNIIFHVKKKFCLALSQSLFVHVSERDYGYHIYRQRVRKSYLHASSCQCHCWYCHATRFDQLFLKFSTAEPALLAKSTSSIVARNSNITPKERVNFHCRIFLGCWDIEMSTLAKKTSELRPGFAATQCPSLFERPNPTKQNSASSVLTLVVDIQHIELAQRTFCHRR